MEREKGRETERVEGGIKKRDAEEERHKRMNGLCTISKSSLSTSSFSAFLSLC